MGKKRAGRGDHKDLAAIEKKLITVVNDVLGKSRGMSAKEVEALFSAQLKLLKTINRILWRRRPC